MFSGKHKLRVRVCSSRDRYSLPDCASHLRGLADLLVCLTRGFRDKPQQMSPLVAGAAVFSLEVGLLPTFLGLTFVPVWATHFRADNTEVVVPQGTDGVHFLRGQDKIEQLDIFFNFREFQCAWHDAHTGLLDEPA